MTDQTPVSGTRVAAAPKKVSRWLLEGLPKPRRPLTNSLLVVATLCLTGVSSVPSATADAGSAQEAVRRARDPLRPLADQLRPGDRVVEFFVEADIDRVLPNRALTPMESLAMTVAESEQVIILELNDAEARLIENGSWIATRLKGKVIEVLKAPKGSSLRVGSQVAFLVGGGELEIRGVIVRAESKSPYEVGRTYAAFLREEAAAAQGITSVVDTAHPLLVDRERIRAVGGVSEELDGIAAMELRSLAKKYR